MKKLFLITTSTTTLLGIVLFVFLLNGCQKNVAPIDQTISYLDELDYTAYNALTNSVDAAIAANQSTPELDALNASVSNVISEEQVQFISTISAQSISDEIESSYFVSEQEQASIDSGNIETVNDIIARFSQPISLLQDEQFKGVLKNILNDPATLAYLPSGFTISDFDIDAISVVYKNDVNFKSAMVTDCAECDTDYSSCVSLATANFLLSVTEAKAKLMDDLSKAELLKNIPVVGQTLYIAFKAIATAKFGLEMIYIIQNYTLQVNICTDAYNTCRNDCHQGGSGN